MAAATQPPSMMTGQTAAMTGNYTPEDDPTLTPSQRRKRPLSIIKESDTDSDPQNCEALVGGKGNNSSGNLNSPRRTSSTKLGQSDAGTVSAHVGPGKVSSPRRTSSATARCSPTIRKLTENFERSPASSPSRAGARAAPRPASTGAIGVKNGKTNNSSGISSNNVNNSNNNGAGSGTSSPRTSSPRTVVNKPGPPSAMKTHGLFPSSSPVSRAVPLSSPTARTSSPSQSSRGGTAATGRKTLQEQEDIMSRLTSGKAAVPSKSDKKKPLISLAKPPNKTIPSSTAVKSGKTLIKREKSENVAQQTKSSDSEENPAESSQNGENELERGEDESSETISNVTTSDKDAVEKAKHVDIFSISPSPSPQRKGSLSPGNDANSIPRDGGGLARIRETAERLKLTSPSSSIASSPAQSPKFGHRVRFAPHHASTSLKLAVTGSQSPPVPRGVAGHGHPSISVPHITVTNSDGKLRGPPPQLGPSIPSNIVPPQTSYSPTSPPLTTISESAVPNWTSSDSQDGNSNINQTDCDRTDSITTDKDVLNQPVSNLNQDVSNNNVKAVLPYNHMNANINYHNNLNTSEHSNRVLHSRSTFLIGPRLNTSTHPQTSTALLPYYKLSSSGFFARRLSSGGSSICEEEEERENQSGGVSNEIKPEDNETHRGSGGGGGDEGGGGRGVKTSSTSSSILLSERGSSVSSLGSNTSINSNNSMEPTSPPLPQPSCLQQQHQITASHLTQLKETADKLRLSTRRDSTMAWRQKYLESPGHMRSVSVANGGLAALDDGKLTQDRKQRIDAALDWLREELQDMRTQDQNLARQLLTIRHDIHQLKLQRSTEEHQDLIDDYWNELEELQEFSDVLDLPQPVYGGDNPLRNVGVTRLNLSARRFSAC